MPSDRETDALVAEKVMGRLQWVVRGSWWRATWDGREGFVQEQGRQSALQTLSEVGYGEKSLPHYTTNVLADYQVLCHVRENWGKEQQQALALKVHQAGLARTWREHQTVLSSPLGYEPGDYSRAALAVVKGEG